MNINNFKTIPAFPDYLIDEFGNVYSTLSNKILKHRIRNKEGYLFVTLLTEDKESKNVSVSRLVAHVYLGMSNIYNNLHVDHIDRNILNNHFTNLQILTAQEHSLKTINDNNLNQRIEINYCKTCGTKVSYNAQYCILHSPVREIKNPNLTINDIENSVKKYGWTQAGKMYNLSDKGLRKNYIRLGGDPKSLRKTNEQKS